MKNCMFLEIQLTQTPWYRYCICRGTLKVLSALRLKLATGYKSLKWSWLCTLLGYYQNSWEITNLITTLIATIHHNHFLLPILVCVCQCIAQQLYQQVATHAVPSWPHNAYWDPSITTFFSMTCPLLWNTFFLWLNPKQPSRPWRFSKRYNLKPFCHPQWLSC